GSYRLEFTKRGFKSSVKTGLQINVTETKRLDVDIEVGSVEERVVVVSESQLLQTESPALGSVTDHEAVVNLPLVTRNYTQIVTLSPGISAGVTNAAALGRGSSGESQGSFRVHGASGADNNFQMNGVEINDLQASGFLSGGVAVPNPDAIQEFKVQTGLYDASYGRNAGANGVGGGATSTFSSPAFTDDRSRAALGKLFAGQAGAQGGVAVAADGSNISAPALALLNLKLQNGQYAIPTPQTVDPTLLFALRG